MKKLFLPFLSIFILIIISCEKQVEETNNLDLSKMQINLEESRLGQTIVLAYYSDISDLQKKVGEITTSLIEDSNEILNNNNEITDVITNIKFSNGKAIISEVFYVNLDTKEIIEGYVLNEETSTYQKVDPNLGGFDDFISGSCPSGYSQIGSCSNLNNPQTCVGNSIQTFLTTNINSIGDCANVQVSVGALNTKVCGKVC